MTIEQAREQMGMSRKDVSEWLGIPYRTLQNWEIGERQCPDYVERLVVEKILRGKEETKEEQ
ncbi:MAG: helix-turn-helix domain-containing protein [Eubacteriales bacterium]|nr:helix-turn-helix domain-containing protein [Eubacteriales bacterium]